MKGVFVLRRTSKSKSLQESAKEVFFELLEKVMLDQEGKQTAIILDLIQSMGVQNGTANEGVNKFLLTYVS